MKTNLAVLFFLILLSPCVSAQIKIPVKDKLDKLKKGADVKTEVKVPDEGKVSEINSTTNNSKVSNTNASANPTTVMNNKKNLSPFQNENAQSGFKDEKGEVVIAAQYDRVYPFKEGLARVRKGGLWGYIDEDGKTVIEIQFDEAKDFSEGFAQVRKSTKEYIINYNGQDFMETVQTFQFSGIRGIMSVMVNNKWGLIEEATGKQLTPFKYEKIAYFAEGRDLCWVVLNNLIGFVDKTGKEVVPPKYNATNNFYDGYCAVNLGAKATLNQSPSGGKWGYIDATGKEVVPLKYDEVTTWFNQGLAPVKLNGNWGAVDNTGKVVVPIQYDAVGEFPSRGEAIASVMLDGKYGFVNNMGKEIFPCKSEKKTIWNDYRGSVVVNGRAYWVNANGEEIK